MKLTPVKVVLILGLALILGTAGVFAAYLLTDDIAVGMEIVPTGDLISVTPETWAIGETALGATQ